MTACEHRVRGQKMMCAEAKEYTQGTHPPFLLAIKGCSGSTYLQHIVRRVFEGQDGHMPLPTDWEVFHCNALHPEKQDSDMRRAAGGDVLRSCELYALCAALTGQRWVAKISDISDEWPRYKTLFQKVGCCWHSWAHLPATHLAYALGGCRAQRNTVTKHCLQQALPWPIRSYSIKLCPSHLHPDHFRSATVVADTTTCSQNHPGKCFGCCDLQCA